MRELQVFAKDARRGLCEPSNFRHRAQTLHSRVRLSCGALGMPASRNPVTSQLRNLAADHIHLC